MKLSFVLNCLILLCLYVCSANAMHPLARMAASAPRHLNRLQSQEEDKRYHQRLPVSRRRLRPPLDDYSHETRRPKDKFRTKAMIPRSQSETPLGTDGSETGPFVKVHKNSDNSPANQKFEKYHDSRLGLQHIPSLYYHRILAHLQHLSPEEANERRITSAFSTAISDIYHFTPMEKSLEMEARKDHDFEEVCEKWKDDLPLTYQRSPAMDAAWNKWVSQRNYMFDNVLGEAEHASLDPEVDSSTDSAVVIRHMMTDYEHLAPLDSVFEDKNILDETDPDVQSVREKLAKDPENLKPALDLVVKHLNTPNLYRVLSLLFSEDHKIHDYFKFGASSMRALSVLADKFSEDSQLFIRATRHHLQNEIIAACFRKFHEKGRFLTSKDIEEVTETAVASHISAYTDHEVHSSKAGLARLVKQPVELTGLSYGIMKQIAKTPSARIAESIARNGFKITKVSLIDCRKALGE